MVTTDVAGFIEFNKAVINLFVYLKWINAIHEKELNVARSAALMLL